MWTQDPCLVSPKGLISRHYREERDPCNRKMMDYDPFNVNQFGEKYRKWLKILMLAVPVLLLLSFIFFLISFASSHDSEVKSINSDIDQWNSGAEADLMASIRMMMKVLPSPGHGVVDRMTYRNTEDLVWTTHGVQSELNTYHPSFHAYTNDTSDKFPTLAFNDRMVPVGLSQEKCVYFSWAPLENSDRPLEYEAILGLPPCPLSQLNAHDPHIGIRVHAWIQKELDINCGGKSCVDSCRQLSGWWVFSKDRQSGKCYAYDLLDTICIKIKHIKDRFGKNKFEYDGGCFATNQTEKYFQGNPGSVYEFQNVTVEVRLSQDPYVVGMGVAGPGLGFSTSMVSGM